MEGHEWPIVFEKMVRDNWSKVDDYITVDEIALFANDNGLVDQTNLEVIE